MTPDEYRELLEFIGIRFDRTDGRLASLEERLTRVESGNESLRDDLRAVAEQVVSNSRRIEQNGRRIEENGRRIEQNGLRIEANGSRIDALASRFGELQVIVSERFDDHERRIGRLE